MWLRTLTAKSLSQALGNSDIQRQPIETAELARAAFHRRRNRGGIRNIDAFGKGLATFGSNLRAGAVDGLLVDVDAGDMRTFTRKQHRHRAAVADRRLRIDGAALAGADHDNAAACEPPVA